MKKEKFEETVMDNKAVLTYFLTVEKSSRCGKIYGIAIEKSYGGEVKERELTGAISTSRERVCALLHSMVSCMITPDILLEVTDDWGELLNV